MHLLLSNQLFKTCSINCQSFLYCIFSCTSVQPVTTIYIQLLQTFKIHFHIQEIIASKLSKPVSFKRLEYFCKAFKISDKQICLSIDVFSSIPFRYVKHAHRISANQNFLGIFFFPIQSFIIRSIRMQISQSCYLCHRIKNIKNLFCHTFFYLPIRHSTRYQSAAAG